MPNSGKVTWRSPSNIALVKYWGKKGHQMPLNPSISMSLTNCYTETSVEFSPKTTNDAAYELFFAGKKNSSFETKIAQFIQNAQKLFPVVNSLHLKINTANSFPHSAGIASSASSFSALALCLCHINRSITNTEMSDDEFYKQASNLARLGSGSACRSIYGGWTLWGKLSEIASSSDEFAIPLNDSVHDKFKNYYDAILVVNSSEKSISSSEGHKLMETNPFKEIRIDVAKENANNLLSALKSGNDNTFREIIEYEAANLHAMFLTSQPHFILAKPETLQIINKLKRFREETNLEFCFTLDAGPNIHLLYPERVRERMLTFIKSELVRLCENGKWIDDKIGQGPKLISD
jgi:diphosphomevalonate decarboxylase